MKQRPNPSIERASQRPLRALWSTAHVERWARSIAHMFSPAFRILLFTAQGVALFGCASDAVTEIQGKVVQRTIASMIQGKVRREPGLSAAQRAISPQQEHSALPTSTYEHKIDVGAGQYVTSVSESSAYQEGTCVRVVVYASSKRARIVEAIHCAP